MTYDDPLKEKCYQMYNAHNLVSRVIPENKREGLADVLIQDILDLGISLDTLLSWKEDFTNRNIREELHIPDDVTGEDFNFQERVVYTEYKCGYETYKKNMDSGDKAKAYAEAELHEQKIEETIKRLGLVDERDALLKRCAARYLEEDYE